MLLPVLLASIVLVSDGVQTLGSELARRVLPMPAAAADLDREITSAGVYDGGDSFVIAYYLVEPDGLLHDLQLRVFDKRGGTWTYGSARGIGGVFRMERAAGFLYVSGHSSPSAARTIVLDQHLKVRNELDGWLELVLPDGRLVFQRSMTHFQPAHAALLAVYDPLTGSERTFYPAASTENNRGLEWASKARDVAVDRTLSEFGMAPDGRIHFNVATQMIQVLQDRSRPLDPPRRFGVVCDVAVRVPTCSEGRIDPPKAH
jgi:hypothetical protein